VTQRASTVSSELLAIIESLPLRPTSGDLLGALLRAEHAGFERGLRRGEEIAVAVLNEQSVESAFLRRQAG
jgi:hypothetical protein